MLHRSWIIGLFLSVLVGLVGCGGSSSSSSSCNPTCRSGYACVSGSCVSACNPACPSGQICQTSATGPMCYILINGPDAGMPSDVPSTGMDVPATGTDTPATGTDTPATGSDTPATNSDVVTMAADGGLGALPCGHPGQPCCQGTICLVGGLCTATYGSMGYTGTCAAYDPPAGSCDMASNCTGGQQCLAITCGNNPCFQCGTPVGTTANGAACTAPNQCVSGNCAFGYCTEPCDHDSDCAGLGATWTCTATNYEGDTVMGATPFFLHGICAHGCQRNQDCGAGQACHPNENFLTDRMDFVCSPAYVITEADGGMGPASPAGTLCSTSGNNTCQSAYCIGATAPYCTAPCITTADCPSPLVCNTLYVYIPSGGTEAVQMCQTP